MLQQTFIDPALQQPMPMHVATSVISPQTVLDVGINQCDDYFEEFMHDWQESN